MLSYKPVVKSFSHTVLSVMSLCRSLSSSLLIRITLGSFTNSWIPISFTNSLIPSGDGNQASVCFKFSNAKLRRHGFKLLVFSYLHFPQNINGWWERSYFLYIRDSWLWFISNELEQDPVVTSPSPWQHSLFVCKRNFPILSPHSDKLLANFLIQQ